MAIVTLLEHLRNTKKRFDLLSGTVTLNNIQIEDYDISYSSLWFITPENHEIQVNIEKFDKIDFDAIISTAKTSIEMHRCFSDLSDSKKYNAYIRDINGSNILSFYKIPAYY
ncbi:hypothetical protein [Neobacillus ginsengisoli]|uniref:Uncharacterized protein n=1 Tax=Neobacillus ginsengisoli TaxID=904295 RepID=A0ABT9XXW8_9BACI|nr:hypothetical protein [Neobacillus ginsengisoli]MDQ0200321.1 hypothetical protein [Neobacillus ginsengisoli]